VKIIQFLSTTLSIDKFVLKKYLATAPHRYKKYKIPKRTKGYRDIAQPAKSLKLLQKIVCEEFLKELPVHTACKSYKKETNIKDNALVHAKNKFLLKMDFKNFFPSIAPKDLIKHMSLFYEGEIAIEDEQLLGKLFFYSLNKGSPLVLSIGAPTSPFISNTILYEFDSLINKKCEQEGVSYSRYADDLAFSTNAKNILFDYPAKVAETLTEIGYPKITINQDKTVFLSRKGNMHITGLVLTNTGEVSLGRKKKRYIKSLVYKYTKEQLSLDEKSYLRGYLSFCACIEPDFISRLEKKYGEKAVHEIRK